MTTPRFSRAVVAGLLMGTAGLGLDAQAQGLAPMPAPATEPMPPAATAPLPPAGGNGDFVVLPMQDAASQQPAPGTEITGTQPATTTPVLLEPATDAQAAPGILASPATADGQIRLDTAADDTALAEDAPLEDGDAPLPEEEIEAAPSLIDAPLPRRDGITTTDAHPADPATAPAAAPAAASVDTPAAAPVNAPVDTSQRPAANEALAPSTPPAPGNSDPAAETWRMPLRPAKALPSGILMGASQPEPGLLRLTGEEAEADLVLNLPERGELPDELRLTLRTSINVLPEVARATISINDGAPQSFPLSNSDDFQRVVLQTSDLRHGLNRLRINLVQPHRIYCGTEASFGVWTEFDLGRSGAPVPADAISLDPAGFAMALESHIADGKPLIIMAGEDEDAALLRHVSDQFSRVLGARVPVQLQSFYGRVPARSAAVALIASDQNRISVRYGASGALVLQIEHVAGSAMPDLDNWLPAIDVSDRPVRLVPGKPTSLADLGSPLIVGNTRYFRHSTTFLLPADWMLIANQKARLDLRYGFAKDLPKGAMLLVKVNGETVRLLPLDRDGGQILPPLPVGFNASLLHGGRNALDFEMMVPGDPPDAACSPRRADMLVVLGDSTLDVPPSPPMQLAGLTQPLAGLRPERIIDIVSLNADASDAGTRQRGIDPLASKAAMLASRLGASDAPDPNAALILSDLSHLSQLPLASVGLQARQIENALIAPVVATAPNVAPALKDATEPSLPRLPRFSLNEDTAPAARPSPEAPGLYQSAKAWLLGHLSEDGSFVSLRERIKAASFLGSTETLSEWLSDKTGTALLMRPDAEDPMTMWLILGPDAQLEDIAETLDTLRETRRADGEAVLIKPDGRTEIWTPIRLPVADITRLEPSSLRTVLGNYASWSPLYFTLATLGLALLSILPALFFIATGGGGRRPK